MPEMKKVTNRHAKWAHLKYPTRTYRGFYDYTKFGRIFNLQYALKNGKVNSVSFESHEAAKKAGFHKV